MNSSCSPSLQARTAHVLALALGAWLNLPAASAAVLDQPFTLDFSTQTLETPPRPEAVPEGAVSWSIPPEAGFQRVDTFSRRLPPLTTGVESETMELRLPLAPGDWHLLLYLDNGYRDAEQTTFTANGETEAFRGHTFGLEKEPLVPPLDQYRVQLLRFRATEEPTRLRLAGAPGGRARLLWLQAIPADFAAHPQRAWFESRLATLGTFGSDRPLDALLVDLERARKDPALANFAHYWHALLENLAFAEQQFRDKGWDWVTVRTDSSMFTRYKQAVSVLDPLINLGPTNNPLFDRALWLRARLLHWIHLEQHLGPDGAQAEADLARLAERHPDEPLIRMYRGERLDLPDRWDTWTPPAHAPAWAVAQIEALGRLREVAHYWSDQQIENGELGGKPDDDVEIFRWWPVLILTGDERALETFRRLADGVWFSHRVKNGYSRVARDVEHSAEFISDTAPALAFFAPTGAHLARLKPSVDLMRDLWTGLNAEGERQFKSAWIGADEILLNPPRNRDVSMNARAVKAVRYYAWLTRDADAIKLLHEWSRTWARAALRTDKGKPAGLFPASLRWPDAVFNGDEPSWHEAHMFWPYFDWTGDGRLYDQLFCTALLTGDDSLLEPFHRTLDLLRAESIHLTGAIDAPAGSAIWAAQTLAQSAGFWGVVAAWRLSVGDDRWDNLLLEHGPAYLRYRLSGDTEPLAASIEASLLAELRYNQPMRTSEVLFTDRVRVTVRGEGSHGLSTLQAMLTGNPVPRALSPYDFVAWEGTPEHFAALVRGASADRLVADLFLDTAAPVDLTARLLRLAPGDYHVRLAGPQGVLGERIITVTETRYPLRLTVPGQQTVTLEITPRS